MRLALLPVFLLVGAPATGDGQTRKPVRREHSIVGTWSLVSFMSTDTAGATLRPLGDHPQGILIYDEAGHVAAQLLDAHRPRFASGDRARGTDAEVRAAFDGSFAYYGHYILDTTRHRITHHVEGASFPNWIGTDLVREYRLDAEAQGEDQLTITTVPQVVAGHRIVTVLVWQRAP